MYAFSFFLNRLMCDRCGAKGQIYNMSFCTPEGKKMWERYLEARPIWTYDQILTLHLYTKFTVFIPFSTNIISTLKVLMYNM